MAFKSFSIPLYLNKSVSLTLLSIFLFFLSPKVQAQFTQSLLENSGATNGTCIQFGPDGNLYVGKQNGEILMLKVKREKANDYVIEENLKILLVKEMQNHKDDGSEDNEKVKRQVTGLVVTGTAESPILYVTSSNPNIGAGETKGDIDLDTNSGVISKLSWKGASSPANTNLDAAKDEDVWEKVDMVRGLPRSEENHATNGIALTNLDGKPYLIVCSGGFTNAGAPSLKFTKITEYALSAAILSVDVTALEGMSIKGSGTEKYIRIFYTIHISPGGIIQGRKVINVFFSSRTLDAHAFQGGYVHGKNGS